MLSQNHPLVTAKIKNRALLLCWLERRRLKTAFMMLLSLKLNYSNLIMIQTHLGSQSFWTKTSLAWIYQHSRSQMFSKTLWSSSWFNFAWYYACGSLSSNSVITLKSKDTWSPHQTHSSWWSPGSLLLSWCTLMSKRMSRWESLWWSMLSITIRVSAILTCHSPSDSWAQ